MSTTAFPRRMHVRTRTDVQIFVKPCFPTDVHTFGLIIEVPNVIGNILHMIEDVTGVPPKHLRIARGGTPLLATDHFSDHNIKEGDTIEAMLRIMAETASAAVPSRMSEER